MSEPVTWGPALAVLAVGLTGGILLAWRMLARRSVPPAGAAGLAARRELEAHRDVLIEQLRELEDTAHGRDPEHVARERERLELEAARVLAALDRHAPTPTAATPGVTKAAPSEIADASAARRAARRGFAWGAVSAAAMVGLALWVAGLMRPRGGGSLTGDMPGGAPAMSSPAASGADEELARLQSAVARNPADLDARLELTQAHLGRRELMQVWEQTQEVLARSPGHPRALSYQALVRLAMGQAEAAEGMLKEAMAAAPDLLEPRLHLAVVYLQTGRGREAGAVLDEAERRFPTQAQALQRMRRELMARLAAAPEPPIDHPEVGTAGGARVSGRIELDAARATASAGSIVFVTARAAGQSEGPPLAVKRLPASFPLAFTLGSEDSMMGQALPDRLRLEARLDSDGDPLTRSPEDPSARLDGVRLGQGGVRLLLR